MVLTSMALSVLPLVRSRRTLIPENIGGVEEMRQRSGREVKDMLYEQFARVGKALSSPKRVEILDLLGQAERTVEALARATGMGVTNTSAHLQALKAARLVETRKEGTKIYYRLADDEVSRLYVAFRDVAAHRLAEVEQIARDYFRARDELEPLTRRELRTRMRGEDVVVVDVRPKEEYAAGHIPGAISLPVAELADRIGELPLNAEVVAYCRGPYCVLALEAVEILRQRGFRTRRLEDGFPEWRLEGLAVAVGEG
jgi:rhodanese-related sulfurtransferase/DNA-binding transcriptional ArsR family regulator